MSVPQSLFPKALPAAEGQPASGSFALGVNMAETRENSIDQVCPEVDTTLVVNTLVQREKTGFRGPLARAFSVPIESERSSSFLF
jgi:hypothetical protein